MSATGRSDVRRPDDAYETPAWCVERLLERLHLPPGRWLEPAVGDGAIVRAVDLWRMERRLSPAEWTVIDPRPSAKLVTAARSTGGPVTAIRCDFLTWTTGGKFDVCITNPPYMFAAEFIAASFRMSRITVMLLRLPFLASAQRAEFMQKNAPDVYVMPNRPSFTGGGTDATDYAWLVWPQQNRSTGLIEVLAQTPRAERASAAKVARGR